MKTKLILQALLLFFVVFLALQNLVSGNVDLIFLSLIFLVAVFVIVNVVLICYNR